MKIEDVHTQSNFKDVSTIHLHIDLSIDFNKKEIIGVARHHIDNPNNSCYFILDTNNLIIEKVTLGKEEFSTNFEFGNNIQFLGRSLKIYIHNNTELINIYYRTTHNSAALQWLEPHQTEGKIHPFLFTQSEAILARSWIPCQDTPANKFSYSADVHVPKALLPLMSAENSRNKNETGNYHFEMKQSIPSYLLALSVGDLVYKPYDHRTGVYAEPFSIDLVHNEFVKIPSMVKAAENLYGKYLWDQFDVLVLPPSFPFGGMENPRLTFATPTVITGDRSLTSLIAHELAHSWSGNLVTNATWNDFWLNEGFTVYFERRIMEEIEGEDYTEMLKVLGYKELMNAIKELGTDNEDTKLKLELKDRDPDEGMTNIAYEKGYFLLLTIEQAIGRENWDNFIKKYFSEFAFKSMTTEKFIELVNTRIIANNEILAEKIGLNKWIYEKGIPDNCPEVSSDRFENVNKTINSWLEDCPVKDLKTEKWSSHEWLHFIQNLPANITISQIEELDITFNFTESGNSEIFSEWVILAIRNNYSKAFPAMEEFLMRVGRRKFLVPIYKALLENPKTQKLAKQIYNNARTNYHYISASKLDEIIK